MYKTTAQIKLAKLTPKKTESTTFGISIFEVKSATIIPVNAIGEVVPPTAPRIDKAPIRIIEIFISIARETAKITIID